MAKYRWSRLACRAILRNVSYAPRGSRVRISTFLTYWQLLAVAAVGAMLAFPASAQTSSESPNSPVSESPESTPTGSESQAPGTDTAGTESQNPSTGTAGSET